MTMCPSCAWVVCRSALQWQVLPSSVATVKKRSEKSALGQWNSLRCLTWCKKRIKKIKIIIKHLIRSEDIKKNKPPQTRFDKYFLEVFFLFFFHSLETKHQNSNTPSRVGALGWVQAFGLFATHWCREQSRRLNKLLYLWLVHHLDFMASLTGTAPLHSVYW